MLLTGSANVEPDNLDQVTKPNQNSQRPPIKADTLAAIVPITNDRELVENDLFMHITAIALEASPTPHQNRPHLPRNKDHGHDAR